jgi:hypothetical protein
MERDPFYLCDYFTLSWQDRDSTVAVATHQRVDYRICVFLDHIGPRGGMVVIETQQSGIWQQWCTLPDHLRWQAVTAGNDSKPVPQSGQRASFQPIWIDQGKTGDSLLCYIHQRQDFTGEPSCKVGARDTQVI